MYIFSLAFFAIISRIRLLYGQTEYIGKIVEHGQYPFVVSIVNPDYTPPYRFCLGTIISPNWILTFVECATGIKKYSIEHGAWWANETQKLTPVIDSIQHPNYDESLLYSIALLRTKFPIKFDRFTQAVKLIPQSQQIPRNSKTFTIAWGSGEDLEVYNSTLLETRNWKTLETAPNFVWRINSLGAPLMYDGYQIGMLVSDEMDNVFYYSDFSVHLDWIYRTINFYDFKEEYSYLKNVEPNCTGTQNSNDILDICCTYPFHINLLELCISLE